jgi:hypothetical protein
VPATKWTDTKNVLIAIADSEGWARFDEVPANTYRILVVAGTLEKTDLAGIFAPHDYDGVEEAKALAFMEEYFVDPVQARTLIGGTKAIRVAYSLDAFAKKDSGMSFGFLVK